MKPALRLVLLILPLLLAETVALAAHGAKPPADGLYLSAEGAPAPQIQTQDGRMLFLGAKRDPKVSVNRLMAIDNANTSFLLDLSLPNDGTVRANSYILLVAGTAYRLGEFGFSGDTTASMSFQISGDANARQVAKYFRVPVAYFRHPGYQLRTSITPAKPAFARGESVTVTLKIVNVGRKAIAFEKDGCDDGKGSRSPFHRFSAYLNSRSIPDIGDNLRVCAGSALSVNILEPGATFDRIIDLGKWFDFRTPGSYDIHGSALLSFVKPGDPLRRISSTYLWWDYVSADSTVVIIDTTDPEVPVPTYEPGKVTHPDPVAAQIPQNETDVLMKKARQATDRAANEVAAGSVVKYSPEWLREEDRGEVIANWHRKVLDTMAVESGNMFAIGYKKKTGEIIRYLSE